MVDTMVRIYGGEESDLELLSARKCTIRYVIRRWSLK